MITIFSGGKLLQSLFRLNNKGHAMPKKIKKIEPELPTKLEVILSLDEVAKRVGRSPRTVRRWFLEEQIMPRPIYMNNAILGWRESVISQWLVNAEQRKEVTY